MPVLLATCRIIARLYVIVNDSSSTPTVAFSYESFSLPPLDAVFLALITKRSRRNKNMLCPVVLSGRDLLSYLSPSVFIGRHEVSRMPSTDATSLCKSAHLALGIIDFCICRLSGQERGGFWLASPVSLNEFNFRHFLSVWMLSFQPFSHLRV